MGESNKSCPKCNGVMSYRLGEYTCEGCGHVESRQIEAPVSGGPSGPGFKGNQQWSGQSAQYNAPPPPESGSLYSPRSYGAGPDSMSEAKPVGTHEYLLVGCVAFFIPLVGVWFAYNWSKQGRAGGDSCLPVAWGWWGLNVLIFIIALFAGR